MTKKTYVYGYAPLSRITDKIENAQKVHSWGYSSYSISFDSVGKGVVLYNRRDVLDWALEEKNYKVMIGVCVVAAQEGRIEVLKWLELKSMPIDRRACAMVAARHAQLHILKWLQEEKGLELDGIMYYDAIRGGHLHVMKWLREQQVPFQKRYSWGESSTFTSAALKGNLDVLQWLHDEGCPWPEDDNCRVSVDYLKPKVIEWCRVNGYGDKIILGW